MNEEILKLLREPTISVDNAARVLKIGRNAAYEAVKRGEIESIPIGRDVTFSMPARLHN